MSEDTIPGVHLNTKGKTILTVVVLLIAAGIAVNSSLVYEAKAKGPTATSHPPPTYTGSAPLAITSTQEALASNNDLILVITPCADAALNTEITNTVVQAADRIRSTDGIYVGVFTLPQNSSLNYPTLLLRLLHRGDSAIYQVTMRSNITTDEIYNNYIQRKYR